VFGGLRGFVVAAALLLPTTGVAQVQVNQVFNLQGPSPSMGRYLWCKAATSLAHRCKKRYWRGTGGCH